MLIEISKAICRFHSIKQRYFLFQITLLIDNCCSRRVNARLLVLLLRSVLHTGIHDTAKKTFLQYIGFAFITCMQLECMVLCKQRVTQITTTTPMPSGDTFNNRHYTCKVVTVCLGQFEMIPGQFTVELYCFSKAYLRCFA